MLDNLGSSLELIDSDRLTYEPQRLSTQKSTDILSLRLSRNPTNVSELTRIITGIKDDLQIDNEDLESYKDRFPEQKLAELLEISSRYAGSEALSESENASQETKDHPIDGPFAFLQAFLVMLQMLSTWGVNAAFGVILDYYLDSNSFPGTTMYEYALMGGAIVFLAQVLAPLTVFLIKFCGQKKVLSVGIILQTAGYILASICKEFWQVFICEGIMIGLSFTLLFIPGTFILPTWFDKRKSAAMGLAVAGSGLGGVVFSLSLNKVIQETGNQKWGLRMIGIVTFTVSSIATIFMRPRNDSTNQRPPFTKKNVMIHLKAIFDFSEFKQYPFILIAVWFGITVMSYVIILYSFANYVTGIGLSTAQASNLVAIINAAQVVGRPLMGQIGDTWGRYNTTGILCAYAGILVFAFWMNATTYAELIVLSIMVGLAIGVGSTMAQSLVLDLLEVIGRESKLPAAWSAMNIVVGLFTLPAEVIGLALKTTGKKNNFVDAQIFSGCCYFFSLLIILVIREWNVRQVLHNRKKKAIEQLDTIHEDYGAADAGLGEEKVHDFEEILLLQARIDRYDHLLGKTPLKYLMRMVYPIRV